EIAGIVHAAHLAAGRRSGQEAIIAMPFASFPRPKSIQEGIMCEFKALQRRMSGKARGAVNHCREKLNL
ncbi:hypothetical protein ACC771_17640, partial [Rhizobium ruizarguesonis]